jgi:hypothetical protein
MYKVRFHLGAGEHFMHWQVKSQNVTAYHDPSKVQLALFDCKLVVQPSTAKKIHEGACKTVCAWIQCQEVQILPVDRIGKNETDFNVRFNPRVDPDWTNDQGTPISGETFPIIFTNDRSLYVMGDAYQCQDYDSVIRSYLTQEQ